MSRQQGDIVASAESLSLSLSLSLVCMMYVYACTYLLRTWGAEAPRPEKKAGNTLAAPGGTNSWAATVG
jgi:hypothetical protein